MELTYSLDQIDEVAQQILDYCKHRTILFYGAMGMGKTTLIKALVKKLGSKDTVSSPSFSIVNEYHDTSGKPIFHFDFYRIEKEEEVFQLGLEDYYEKAAWIFVEWPQKINNYLPEHYHSSIIESTMDAKKILIIK